MKELLELKNNTRELWKCKNNGGWWATPVVGEKRPLCVCFFSLYVVCWWVWWLKCEGRWRVDGGWWVLLKTKGSRVFFFLGVWQIVPLLYLSFCMEADGFYWKQKGLGFFFRCVRESFFFLFIFLYVISVSSPSSFFFFLDSLPYFLDFSFTIYKQSNFVSSSQLLGP